MIAVNQFNQVCGNKGEANVKNNIKLMAQAVSVAMMAIPAVTMAVCGDLTSPKSCSEAADNFDSAGQNMTRLLHDRLVTGKVSVKPHHTAKNETDNLATISIGEGTNANKETGDYYGLTLGRSTLTMLNTENITESGFFIDYNKYDYKSENVQQLGALGYWAIENEFGGTARSGLVAAIDFANSDFDNSFSGTSTSVDYQTKGIGFGMFLANTFGVVTPGATLSYSTHSNNKKVNNVRGNLKMLKAGGNVGVAISNDVAINAAVNYNQILDNDSSVQDHHFLDLNLKVDVMISSAVNVNAGFTTLQGYTTSVTTATGKTSSDIENNVVYAGVVLKY